MTTNLFTRTHFTAAFVAVALFLGGCKDSALEEEMLSAVNVEEASTSNTAQSIMVDVNYNVDVIDGSDVYRFDEDRGAGFFTGGTLQQRKNVAKRQKCSFYNGRGLVSETIAKTTITPISSDPVPSKTAWDLTSSTPGSAEAAIDIVIAGQSVVLNKRNQTKYSFSLTDKDGNSRIDALKIEVTGQNDRMPIPTILTNDESNTCLAGTLYTGNAGTFGNAISSLNTNMTMGEIIALNTFGSTAVCGNAAIAKVERLIYQLGVGSYTVRVSGIVKGNGVDFTTSQPFNVVIPMTIDAEGCK